MDMEKYHKSSTFEIGSNVRFFSVKGFSRQTGPGSALAATPV